MDPVKVKGITNWPTLTNVKDVRSFLGFCNFYRAFILNFSTLAWPLDDLTKKNYPWKWNENEQHAFQNLKDVCASDFVLRTPDWSKQFIMETNALGFALGAVIMQKHEDGIYPIAFHSQSLLTAEKNYNTHDKELAGVVFGFKCGQPFFLEAQHPIIVRTNHKNLQYFREPHKINGRQARWLGFLQDFDYQLKYILGSSNTIVDLLSHCKDLNKGVNTEEPRVLLPDTLFSSTALQKIFIEDDKTIWQNALREIHNSQAGGHSGIANTWEPIRQHYEGPRLREFVEAYIKGCIKCQESKTNLPWKNAPLQCFDVLASEGPFRYVSMNLTMDLPKLNSFDFILTIVDQGCSKAAKFIPCHKTIDGPEVALEYLKHLVPWFGIPSRIISDHNPRFASTFSQALCCNLGIQQNLSTTFHPRTDGQTERMNAWIKQYLRPWTTQRQNNWAKLLPVAEFAHNSWKNDTMRKSPHELLIGIKPQVIVKFLDNNIPAALDRLRLVEEFRKEVQTRLEQLQKDKDVKIPM